MLSVVLKDGALHSVTMHGQIGTTETTLIAPTAPVATPTAGETTADGKLSETAKCTVEAVHSGKQGADLQTAIEDCSKAPNPLLPATNEIFWGALGFLVVFVFLAKFGYPAIKKGMDARTERIRNSLDEADKAKADAQGILEDYQRQLADAKSEAGRIIDEARQAADAVRRELTVKAEADAQAIRERATADIQVQIDRATADLRADVARLAVDAAESVLGRQLGDRAMQVGLIEDFINSVGA